MLFRVSMKFVHKVERKCWHLFVKIEASLKKDDGLELEIWIAEWRFPFLKKKLCSIICHASYKTLCKTLCKIILQKTWI